MFLSNRQNFSISNLKSGFNQPKLLMRLTYSNDSLGSWCVQKSDELLFDDVGQKETGHDFLGVGDGLVQLGSCRFLQNVNNSIKIQSQLTIPCLNRGKQDC